MDRQNQQELPKGCPKIKERNLMLSSYNFKKFLKIGKYNNNKHLAANILNGQLLSFCYYLHKVIFFF